MMKTILNFVVFVLLTNFLNAQVLPLVTSVWGQKCYYNANCPTVGSGGACGKAYTGCYATAVAQMMRYYAYPTTGIGSHCNSNSPAECVNFAAETYNYTLMPNGLTAPNAEVAKLIYDVGVANDMQWSGTISSSYFQTIPLIKYFKYSPRMKYASTYMYDTLQNLVNDIKKELDEGRVVFCKTNALNHFYLIDGYNAVDQFHCNFGWQGTYNGYYDIDSVFTPVGNATPQNFVFNIHPLQGNLETYSDTIHVIADSNTQSMMFTSLLNWNMSSPSFWIDLNQTSGSAGAFVPNDGESFHFDVNNGAIRFGYVYIDNGSDVDTIVVEQAASPFTVTPDSLSFPCGGDTQNVELEFPTWQSWSSTTPNSWISVSIASGTGSDTLIAVTATPNTMSAARQGLLVLTLGIHTDTVKIYQEGLSTTSIAENKLKQNIVIYPNPTKGILYVESINLSQKTNYCIQNILGQTLMSRALIQNTINMTGFPKGIYFIKFTIDNHLIQSKKFIVK